MGPEDPRQPWNYNPANPPPGMKPPPDIFDPAYVAKQKAAGRWADNPFTPGTSQFNDFAKEQQQTNIKAAGQPVMPQFNTLIDKNTGLLNGNLNAKAPQISSDGIGHIGFGSEVPSMQGRLDQVQLNKNPLNALEAEGTRTGPSAWSNLMHQSLGNKENAALEKVGGQAMGANAAAENSLAMRGGLGSGARTSLAKDMQRGINQQSQQVRQDFSNQGLGVDMQDEQNRLGILQQLPGMELNAMQPDMQKAAALNDASLTEQGRNLDASKYNSDTNFNLGKYNADSTATADKYNIGNALNEQLQNRGYDLNNYNEMMKAWGADKTASAQGSGGKK